METSPGRTVIAIVVDDKWYYRVGTHSNLTKWIGYTTKRPSFKTICDH